MNKLKQGHEKKAGFFCEVTKFTDENGKEFARKTLKKMHVKNDDYRYRLTREIDLLKELQGHKHIIELIDYSKSEADVWYLMPYAKQNLYDYIKDNNQKLAKEERFQLAEQIISAIKYAHDKNKLHRDISPSNILLLEDEGMLIVKVCDFGLGKDRESLSFHTKSSASGYGQILYVAPEQKIQLNKSTNKSDIYSLGKLMYFIFTGRDPNNYKSFELDTLYTKATE
jgi:eukaryotic-like serine/threonine-protein kinase